MSFKTKITKEATKNIKAQVLDIINKCSSAFRRNTVSYTNAISKKRFIEKINNFNASNIELDIIIEAFYDVYYEDRIAGEIGRVEDEFYDKVKSNCYESKSRDN